MNLYNATAALINHDQHAAAFVKAGIFTHKKADTNGVEREYVLKHDVLFPPAKVVDEMDYSEVDTCILDDHKPGTAARIEELKKFYSENGENSPFVVDIDEEVNGILNSVANTPEKGRTDFQKAIAALAVSTYKEVFNNGE